MFGTSLTPDDLHHAYLCEGERSLVVAEIVRSFAAAGITQEGDPDFHIYEYDMFLIDHAHDLREEQSRVAFGDRKIFIVAFNTMTLEAQNAILKTLEEPTAGTHFFFVTRTGETLLPTVRSRMQIVNAGISNKEGERSNEEVTRFLDAKLSERMKIIEPFTKAKTDGKSEAKEGARSFLDSLECALYERIREPGSRKALEDVISAKRYLSDRSPSLKILLEHLALSIPSPDEPT